MKTKLDIVFTNELDMDVFNNDFYLMLFENIVKLKNQKGIKKLNTNIDK